jgi:hypothetical protein
MIECPKMVMVPLMITVMEKVNSVRGKQGDQCSLLKTKHKFRCHIPLKSVCRKGISEPQKNASYFTCNTVRKNVCIKIIYLKFKLLPFGQ